MKPVRTRFAPSPTGFLHIGGARTALFSWLYARKNQGTFILRIEDTDLERSSEASIQAILDAMQWLQLDFDEGPIYQTDRFERYREVIQQMVEQGTAYPCYCSKERLQNLRDEQTLQKQKPRYDGHCRDLKESQEGPHVIRFKNPIDGDVTFNDLIRGPLTFSNTELDDLIIARSDGVPTYNFTVVVDDWDMEISHVIRGDDHINNTPRQINILRALGASIPEYAHVSMILGADGKRLSKRHGAVSVMQFRDEGFLPESLLNYLARLGWSHGDQEIFSREELIEFFGFDHVNKAPAAFNADKLMWINQHYLKTNSVDALAKDLEIYFKQLNIPIENGPALTDILTTYRERAKTLLEIAEKSRFFYEDVTYNNKAVSQHLTREFMPILDAFISAIENVSWEKAAIHGVILQTAENFNLKLGKIAQPIRVALTGDTVSPSLDETMFLLGQAKVRERLVAARELCHNHPQSLV